MGLELRADAVLGSAPEPDAEIHVNLAPWQGEARGVSLRHALLRPGKDKLFLMDLGSTNGTHYNGMPLSADRVQAVQPGDLITLGRLHLRVKKVVQIDAAPSQPSLSE
jgi:pSer/pThr/pTyr-binding forkhead associated (FHA) protein